MPTSSQAAAQPETPAAGGKVVVIEMLTDDGGNNVFRPAEFTVKKGDLVKFTLGGGVHNVHFPADSNTIAGAKMPPAGPMLQLPGTSTNILVDFPPGTYFYQCDPHALLGMVGRMTVAP
ncbi:MAG: plastocyanin/azurin family copper-binding protein [Gemmatimonadaceae bacterium]|nr:plastocyanin/azurin family copper-binding protein [Gemmatimonadaceae bacterium]